MTRRAPRPQLSRRQVHEPRPELLVFTEGERTESGYLHHWRRAHRETVLVTVDEFHGPPMSLVNRAADAKRTALREEAHGRGRAYDEVWCVFDRDEHPDIPQALDKASANGIGIVLSDPCIEIWFVLHFAEQTAHIDRMEAQALSRSLLGCDKALSVTALDALASGYQDAKRRAIDLDRKHDRDGSPPHSNPSSNMWQLVDRIRGV